MPGSRHFYETAFFSAAIVAGACGGTISGGQRSELTAAVSTAARTPAPAPTASLSLSPPPAPTLAPTPAPSLSPTPAPSLSPTPAPSPSLPPSPTAIASGGQAKDKYLSANPVTAKSIGPTSYVLKVTLEGGLVVAFKPRSTLPLGDRRYKGEIAAYRLARALGLDNVPRAVPRTFVASTLHQAFATPRGAAEFEQQALVDTDGRVHGALMPWITEYRSFGLEEPSWRAKWTACLIDGKAKIAAADRPLASAMSTMLVFDYVTANWDRWSGGNVALGRATGGLLFVDNDGAFYERPPQDALSQQVAFFPPFVLFSRKFPAAPRPL